MSYHSKCFAIALSFAVFYVLSTNYSLAQISCREVKFDAPNHHENMDELARRAGLPDNYWSRYHKTVVDSLCSGDIKEVDTLVENGYVEAKEAKGIARVLGIAYKTKPRSQMGKKYGYSMGKFIEMGACNACASHIAEYYTKKPNSRCGKLAKQALEGNPDAVKKLIEFPDYCQWKY